MTRRPLLLAAALLLAFAASALVWWWTNQPSHAGILDRTGQQFSLDGRPYRFVGANLYNAAGDTAIYQCGPWMEHPDQDLDAWFRRAREEFDARVVRFSA